MTADSPRERRILYAPTNHNHGGGSSRGFDSAMETVYAVERRFETSGG